MSHRVLQFLVGLLAFSGACALAQPADQRQAYPIKLDPAAVRELTTLRVNRAPLQLKGGRIAVTPIDCEAGTTGAFLIGNGTFRFAPQGADPIEGHFRAAMLRFHPNDGPQVLPLDKANVVTDLAAFEMSRHLLGDVFGHCWHSGDQALIPDEGTVAVVLYSQEHGDLLISVGGEETIAHCFSSGKQLYPNP